MSESSITEFAKKMQTRVYDSYGIKIRVDDPAFQLVLTMYEHLNELEVERRNVISNSIDALVEKLVLTSQVSATASKEIAKDIIKAFGNELRSTLNDQQGKGNNSQSHRIRNLLYGLYVITTLNIVVGLANLYKY